MGVRNKAPLMAEESEMLKAVATGIGGAIAFIVGIIGLLDGGDPTPLIIGVALLIQAVVHFSKGQQQLAENTPIVGQPQDMGVGGWERLEKIMERVENPDTFQPGISEVGERPDTLQAMMDAEFHGDAFSNFEDHSDGVVSAVPKDFHDGTYFWQNPEKGFLEM